MNPLELAAAKSPWADRNVGEKALLFLGLVLLCLSLPPIPTLPVVAIVLLIIISRCSGRWRLYFGLCAAPLSFIIIGIIPLVISLSPSGIEVHTHNWHDAATVFARSGVSTATIMGFAVCTPISELIAWGLTIKLPTSLVYVIMLMYRMINTLIIRARTMWEAQGMRLGRTSMRRWISSAAGQAAGLFVISLDHSRRLSEGLELRAEPTAMLVATPTRPASLPRIGSYLILFVLIIAINLL